jgi:hypothetical protein
MKKAIVFLILSLCFTSCSPKPAQELSPTIAPTDSQCNIESINSFIESAQDVENSLYHLSQQAVMEIALGDDIYSTVGKMFSVESEIGNIDTPVCALKTRAALTSYVDTFVQVYAGLYVDSAGTPSPNGPITSENYELASSKYDYYQTKMYELRSLLIEKCLGN